MGIRVTYTADSLAAIAEDFDRRADELDRRIPTAPRQEKTVLNAQAETWRLAADILHSTTITPPVPGGRN